MFPKATCHSVIASDVDGLIRILTVRSFTTVANVQICMHNFKKMPSFTSTFDMCIYDSAEWGENGFMRLRRTTDEGSRCGVDKSPSEGIACKGDPPTQKVCGTCGILLDPVLPLVQE